jgi:peptidoglycan/LPS O-acetylase OafA/YrhL
MRKMVALSGLRGLAAWIVVVYHFREVFPRGGKLGLIAAFFDLGYLAVDLFFILSGFILYLNYGQRFRKIEFKSVFKFYGKRLARIYPLHIFLLFLFLVNPIAISFFSQQSDLSDRYDPFYFLLSLFLVQNWGFSDNIAWNVPAWSISTEFAAYLIFPFAAFAVTRVKFILALAVYGLALGWLYWIFKTSGHASLGGDIAELGLYRCIVQFFLGMLIGWFFQAYNSIRAVISLFSGVVVVGGMLLYFMINWFSQIVYIPLMFTFLLLYLLNENSLGSRLLGGKWFEYLGEISYSTYLVHYFVKDWVKFASADVGLFHFSCYLVLVFLMSILLYRFVELPCRVFGYRRIDKMAG